MTDTFAAATAVADAVLYEGYLLYPYRASSDKNRMRFQFGVLVPADAVESTGEASHSRTELLCEPDDGATLRVRLRFLHLRRRTVERRDDAGFVEVPALTVGDREHTTWDEATEREIDAAVPFAELLAGEIEVPFDVPASEETETLSTEDGAVVGRVIRRYATLRGVLRVSAAPLIGPFGGARLRLDVHNTTEEGGADSPDRGASLLRSFIGAHTLLGLDGGGFISLVEPPEWAAPAVAECVNVRGWPVLVGDPDRRDTVLSAPIILYDFPSIAPESPGPLFDGTEIDEILTLRTMTLTEDEKRQARDTDDRARAILDRVDNMPPELLDRLHGTVRYLRQVTGPADVPAAEPDGSTDVMVPDAPWWNPAADASVDPDTDTAMVDGVAVRKGSRVRLAPRLSGTDAQDMFLHGMLATVQAVVSDVDGSQHVAVTIDDDPAAELQFVQGRFRYFAPTELVPAEPVERAVTARILVAGIGNIFFGDDGFGVEVAARLAAVDLPAEVKVVDYGIRGIHLAYDMLAGYDVTVLVDTVARGDAPGTIYVLDVNEVGVQALATPRQLDPHGMTPDAVLAHVYTLGGDPGHVFVVGCEPADCDERIGLSPIVAAAVDAGVTAVIELVHQRLAALSTPQEDQPHTEEVRTP